MNTTQMLWLIAIVLVLIAGRGLWIAIRLWWIMSKGGHIQYSFGLWRTHYWIAFQTWIYIWRLRYNHHWHRVRLWWWTWRITHGFKAKYPKHKLPVSPHSRRVDEEERRRRL